MFYFRAGSAKTQHAQKQNSGQPNADMTLARPSFGLVADGVSGVAEFGLQPADLTNDFRAEARTLLTTRNGAGADRSLFDNEL